MKIDRYCFLLQGILIDSFLCIYSLPLFSGYKKFESTIHCLRNIVSFDTIHCLKDFSLLLITITVYFCKKFINTILLQRILIVTMHCLRVSTGQFFSCHWGGNSSWLTNILRFLTLKDNICSVSEASALMNILWH